MSAARRFVIAKAPVSSRYSFTSLPGRNLKSTVRHICHLAGLALALALFAQSGNAFAMKDEEHRMGGIPNMPAHILKMDGGGHEGHGRPPQGFGVLGTAAKVTRTIHIRANDRLHFAPKRIVVNAGETVELVLHNDGAMRHELVIGDRAHQAEYERIVAAMPDTRHEHDNVLVVHPGELRSIIWTFGKASPIELACHMDGHYQAGMLVEVQVNP